MNFKIGATGCVCRNVIAKVTTSRIYVEVLKQLYNDMMFNIRTNCPTATKKCLVNHDFIRKTFVLILRQYFSLVFNPQLSFLFQLWRNVVMMLW